MERLGLSGNMTPTIAISLRIELPQELQALIEYRIQDFIAIFHRLNSKKRCKFSKNFPFIKINTIYFL